MGLEGLSIGLGFGVGFGVWGLGLECSLFCLLAVFAFGLLLKYVYM